MLFLGVISVVRLWRGSTLVCGFLIVVGCSLPDLCESGFSLWMFSRVDTLPMVNFGFFYRC